MKGISAVRIESNRFIVVGDSAVVVALATIGRAAPKECLEILRIEPYCLIKIRNGAVVVLNAVVNFSAIKKKYGKIASGVISRCNGTRANGNRNIARLF